MLHENISNDIIKINYDEEKSFLGGSLIFDPAAILIVFLLATAWNKRRN